MPVGHLRDVHRASPVRRPRSPRRRAHRRRARRRMVHHVLIPVTLTHSGARPMTITPAAAADTSTVELAEAAWLSASLTAGPDAMRALMHPDCVVVHAAVGHIHGVDDFLRHT